MLRVIVAAVMLSAGLTVAPVARADPQTCPPTCDRIPGEAWMRPWDVPLGDTHHWPDLARGAVPVTSPRFKFEELCGSPTPLGDPRGYAVAARSSVARPPGQWQLHAQVVHWRGETWRGGELAMQVFDTAVAALRGCQATAPDSSPSVTTAEPDRLAAVISGPQVVHLYLIADTSNSSLSELVFWSLPGPAPQWPTGPDDRVLDAMSAALCGAYLASCG